MNNIEKNIKKEFQQRKIQPSLASWDKLSQKLDTASPNKKNKKVLFYSIAAILIGLLVMLSAFFNNRNEVVTNQNQIVKTGIKRQQESNIKSAKAKVEKVLVKNEIDDKVVVKNNSTIKYKINKIVAKTPSKKVFVKTNSSTQIAVNNSKEVTNNNNHKNFNKVTNTQKQIATNTVETKDNSIPEKNELSKVKKTKILMNSSNDDIDNLLASALKSNSKTTIKKVAVQGQELAYSIENDLNKETKTRFYKMIKAGVDTVENIVVSNNN